MLRVKGQTLITVPCWWDGKKNSLIATICFERPDLIYSLSKYLPISMNPPKAFFDGASVPDIGELMLASFPHPSQFLRVRSPWWVGEKYDGIRALTKFIYSRTGVLLQLPSPFLKKFNTSTFLDGEIWFGRGLFVDAQRFIHAIYDEIDWSSLRMAVFDTADPKMRNIPYESRITQLLDWLLDNLYGVISRILCKDKATLLRLSSGVIDHEGEGLIMRRPRSAYVKGRSNLLFKFKASRGDMEVLVSRIDYLSKQIELKMPDGNSFTVDSRCSKVVVKKGDIVTLAYESYTRSLAPINPTIIRVRTDVSWKDVSIGSSGQAQLNEPSLRGVGVGHQPSFTEEKRKQLRGYLEEFARKLGMNPLTAESWYNINTTHIDPRSAYLYRYKGSLVSCLIDNFPEVTFDKSKFVNVSRNHWKEPRNRRKFFIDLASSKGFDPVSAKDWYSLSFDDFVSCKGASTILRYYNWSISKALLNCFPEIGFDVAQFPVQRQVYQLSHARQELEDMAKKLDFDPNVRDNWYSVSKHDLRLFSGVTHLLKHYGSLANMLNRLFPELRPFNSTKFLSSGFLGNDNALSREVFVKYAKRIGFNPLVPDNWYALNAKSLEDKDILLVLRKYNGSMVKCLLDVFPEVAFDTFKFSALPQGFWGDPENQRTFFINFAATKGFDPLVRENWYQVPMQDFNVTKNALTILKYYGGDYLSALATLFPTKLAKN